jgi:hypothetical protein
MTYVLGNHDNQRRDVSRTQQAEMTEWQRQMFKERAISDLGDDPPDNICDVRGLSSKRARYARYCAWRQREAKELRDLEQKKVELQSVIAGVEAEIRNGIRRLADRFLGRVQDSADADAKALTADLLAQRRVEAARLAMPELEQQIERAQFRVARLEGREKEFLRDAIIEMADASGLGRAYLKKIGELQEIMSLVLGLMKIVGGNTRFHNQEFIGLPRINLPSIAKADFRSFRLSSDGNESFWRDLEKAVRLDPCNSRHHIPLPK